jgi:transmembrane sensor
MSGPRDIDGIEAAAAAWDAQLRGTRVSDADREGFRAWLEAEPEHRAAYERLEAAISALRMAVETPGLSALRDEARAGLRRARGWRLGYGVAAAAALALIALGAALQVTGRTDVLVRDGRQYVAVAQGAHLYRTALNERTKVALADGSAVTLDSDTRLLVKLGAAHRDVTLLAGRALFEVAKDPRRPFTVRAGDRTVTALGTIFDVRLDEKRVHVTLLEGRVVVRPVGRAKGEAQVLEPSQQLVERAEAGQPVIRVVDAGKALGWIDGQVFFEDETLENAAREMNRYARAKIVVADPAIADLRINGMFRAGNQTGFAGALQTTLPVEVRSDDRGQIVVTGLRPRTVTRP